MPFIALYPLIALTVSNSIKLSLRKLMKITDGITDRLTDGITDRITDGITNGIEVKFQFLMRFFINYPQMAYFGDLKGNSYAFPYPSQHIHSSH